MEDLKMQACARQLCFPKSTISLLPRFHPAAAVGLVRCSSGQWAFIWYATRPPTAGALCVRRQHDTLMSPLIRAWKLDRNQMLSSQDIRMCTQPRNGAALPFGALVNQCIVSAFSSILCASHEQSKSLRETREKIG